MEMWFDKTLGRKKKGLIVCNDNDNDGVVPNVW